jgi:hypothetical protein
MSNYMRVGLHLDSNIQDAQKHEAREQGAERSFQSPGKILNSNQEPNCQNG